MAHGGARNRHKKGTLLTAGKHAKGSALVEPTEFVLLRMGPTGIVTVATAADPDDRQGDQDDNSENDEDNSGHEESMAG